MAKFPPRLHCLLASKSQVAVVLRRGPSKQVAAFLWDRKTDSFELGQWIKGRIYERRTDLSPNGQHLIYFAMNGKWDSETGGSWTAVSKAPWLKALDLYRKGDCWEGGGLFLSNKSYWLNDRYFSKSSVMKASQEVARDSTYKPAQSYGAECTGVYYPRLLRDGWSLVERRQIGSWDAVTIFEKVLPKKWVLRKIAHEQVGAPPGKGCYWDEHQLLTPNGGVMPRPDWEWAELDGNRLVWAQGGQLGASRLAGSEWSDTWLHDFNPYVFEERVAPY